MSMVVSLVMMVGQGSMNLHQFDVNDEEVQVQARDMQAFISRQ